MWTTVLEATLLLVSEKVAIWQHLRSRREDAGLTLRGVVERASELGKVISRGTVDGAESPGARPTLGTLETLAAVYGDSLDDYLRIMGKLRHEPGAPRPADWEAFREWMKKERLVSPDARKLFELAMELEIKARATKRARSHQPIEGRNRRAV